MDASSPVCRVRTIQDTQGLGLVAPIVLKVVDEYENPIGMPAEASSGGKRDLLFGATGDLGASTTYHLELPFPGTGRELWNTALNRESADSCLCEPREQLGEMLFLRLTGNQKMDMQEVMVV